MDEVQKPDDKLTEEIFNKTFGLVGYLFKNTKYLLLLILYMVLSLIFLFLIITSSQEIMSSKLISFIITMYFKDKLLITTTLIGLGSALTLLIGHISSENEEKVIGREGKLLSGLTFWNRNFLTSVSGLILITVFAKTYYKTFNYQELLTSIILITITTLLWTHFTDHLNNVYDWNTLENNEHKIFFDIILGGFAFNIGFFFYIYSLPYVETWVFNVFNLWMLFINVIFFASFKYPRTQKIIVKYSDDREEYAHLVRIENGFARIITKESLSKQIIVFCLMF
jgi:hypothetical protein